MGTVLGTLATGTVAGFIILNHFVSLGDKNFIPEIPPSRIAKDQIKTEFLSQNNPSLKVVREEVKHQIWVCEDNIKKLRKLQNSFDQQYSRMMLDNKITQLDFQKKSLEMRLNTIDAEVERGIANKQFIDIEGGGLRSNILTEVLENSRIEIINARKLNAEYEKLSSK